MQLYPLVLFHQECVPQDLVCDSSGQPAPITKPSKRLPHESKMRLQVPVRVALVKRLLGEYQTPNILEYHPNINDDPNSIQTSSNIIPCFVPFNSSKV